MDGPGRDLIRGWTQGIGHVPARFSPRVHPARVPGCRGRTDRVSVTRPGACPECPECPECLDPLRRVASFGASQADRSRTSGRGWPDARSPDEGSPEAAPHPAPAEIGADASSDPEVDRVSVGKVPSGRGVTPKLPWREWIATHPGAMSHPTWCRRFRFRTLVSEATVRRARRPGGRPFVECVGIMAGSRVDGADRDAGVFVAAMGESGSPFRISGRSVAVDPATPRTTPRRHDASRCCRDDVLVSLGEAGSGVSTGNTSRRGLAVNFPFQINVMSAFLQDLRAGDAGFP